MGIQFFGEFLLDRLVITREQLLEALELQEYRNVKFGSLAVRQGYLKEEQVQQISELQKTQDMRFGDLVVAKGWMKPEQVQEILTLQKNSYLYLGEALLELGYVARDALERELATFQEEQSRFRTDQVVLPNGIEGAEILHVAVDLTRKFFVRVVGVLIKVGAGEALGSDKLNEGEYHLSVSVKFKGWKEVQYVLSVSSDLAVAIASRILKEDATRESEEMVEDAVKEFCNMVCGNTAAKLAQQGISVDIEPPESDPLLTVPAKNGVVVVFPVRIGEGKVDIRFVTSRR
jgi:CheY-specific phosphatase CheX